MFARASGGLRSAGLGEKARALADCHHLVRRRSRSIDLIRNVSGTSTLRSALCAQPIDHCPFFRAYERNWHQKKRLP